MRQYKKNTASQPAMFFVMLDSTNHLAVAGKTVTITKALDAATSWSSTTGTVAEAGNGGYWFSPSAADLNGDSCAYKATASGCDTTFFDIVTTTALNTDIKTETASILSTMALDSTVAKESTTQTRFDTIDTTLAGLGGAIFTGQGAILVNHDYGSSSNLKITDEGASPLDNAEILIYLKSDYLASNIGETYVKGFSITIVDGTWEWDIHLDPATYYVIVNKDGYEQIEPKELVVI